MKTHASAVLLCLGQFHLTQQLRRSARLFTGLSHGDKGILPRQLQRLVAAHSGDVVQAKLTYLLKPRHFKARIDKNHSLKSAGSTCLSRCKNTLCMCGHVYSFIGPPRCNVSGRPPSAMLARRI